MTIPGENLSVQYSGLENYLLNIQSSLPPNLDQTTADFLFESCVQYFPRSFGIRRKLAELLRISQHYKPEQLDPQPGQASGANSTKQE